MISWIQNHLIRHGRWIFLTLLALIIVAFVFTIGNTPGCTSDRTAYQSFDYYGYDLNSQRDIDPIAKKASLSAMLSGKQIQGEQQFQAEVMARIAILALAERLAIPAPSQEVLAGYIKTKAAFRGQDGAFSADAYTRFIDNMESNPEMSQGMVIAALEEDYVIEQVRDALAGPGYVLPAEAKLQVQDNQTSLQIEVAQFSYIDFAPEFEISEESLKTYYNSHNSRYEIPERIEASYAYFPTADYADQVEAPTETQQKAYFIANRSRFVQAQDAESADTVTFEDVQAAVLEEMKANLAARAANEAAQNFALTLYRSEIKRDSPAFNKLLNESGITLAEIEPYTAAGAQQRALSTEMLQSAFALSKERYFSDAYPVDEGFAILIYQGRIAPVIPEFDAIKEEVTRDYRSEEKRRLFNARAQELQAELSAKLKEGQSFMEGAEALGLTVESYESFKVSEAPENINPSLVQRALSMEPETVSPMVQLGTTGHFIYLAQKEIPEIADDDEDYTQTQAFLSSLSSYLSANSLGNELVTQGLPEQATE